MTYKIFIMGRQLLFQEDALVKFEYAFKTNGNHVKLIKQAWLSVEAIDESPKITDEFVLTGALADYAKRYPDDEFEIDASRGYETFVP